ncbi:amidohydrolase [Brachybacterium sp. EF45031]|uniref:M20 metallopeptidase family protein n=1 Tax=Brachybacterium sillae TaxID=2810536 RepID=UPI00217DBF6A|nr:M20 family metallopeptidase [Brachybacterium sillae]MCS6711144.1 amidohydrolase [Brachybacterium sillae]
MTPASVLDALDRRAEETAGDMIEWRHHLHQHPELSNREEQTAAFIAERLAEFDLDEVRTDVAGHGVVAVLRGGAEPDGDTAGTVLLRADIDALPVPDESAVDFASEVIDTGYPGGPFPVSHACGHDCHTAMLLGAMRILAEQRDQNPGTIVAVFQPAEEGAPPDELGGARHILDEGALDGLEPTMAFGMHVQPFPKGMVAARAGNQFGASCMVKITVTGEQVHGSTPWKGKDPMPAAGSILSGIGQIYRQLNAFDAFTVSIGHVQDVGRFNVIGRTVTLWGTIRATRQERMQELQERVERLAVGSTEAMGCTAEVEFLQDVPPVHNRTEWVEALSPTFADVVGAEKVLPSPPTLGYDDVSEFVNRYGGLYVGLGVQDTQLNEAGDDLENEPGGRGMVPNHHPAFYADNETLVKGVLLHAHVAVDHLWGRATV